jgi:hypothetical protein
MDLFAEAERAAAAAYGRAAAHFERVWRLPVTTDHELLAKEAQLRAARKHMYFRRDELARIKSPAATVESFSPSVSDGG